MEFLTSSEAAERLGYTRQHVRRLIRLGRLSGQKIGRDWMVPRASVESIMADRENLAFELRPGAPKATSDERLSA